MIRLFLILFYGLFSFLALAQDYCSYSFNELYDFDQKVVFDIEQNKNGQIWIAGVDGLVRFDGKNFKTFKHPDFSADFTNIKFDQYNRVWCSNFSGQLFYVKEDSMYLAANYSSQKTFVSDYQVYSENVIYLFTQNSLEVFRHDLIKNEGHSVLQMEGSIQGYFKEKTLYLIVSKSNEVKKFIKRLEFDLETEKIKNKSDVQEFLSFSAKEFYLKTEFGEYLFWIFDGLSAMKFSKKQNQLELDFLVKGYTTFEVNGVAPIGKEWWVLTRNGADIVDSEGNIVEHDLYEDWNISTCFKDQEGNIWIGTLNRGVFIIPNRKIRIYKTPSAEAQYSTFDRDSNFYFNDIKGDIFRSAPPYGKFEKLNHREFKPASLFFNPAQNIIHIGHFYGNYIELPSGKIKTTEHQALIFRRGYVVSDSSAFLDRYSSSYIVPLHKNSGDHHFNFKAFPESRDFGNRMKLKKSRSKHIALSKDSSHLYINYTDGLTLFSRKKEPEYVVHQGTPLSCVNMVQGWKKNTIWAITSGQELVQIEDLSVKRVIKLPISVHKMAKWKNYIFLGGNSGLLKIHLSEESIEIINEEDGLVNTQLIDFFVWQDTLHVFGENMLQKIPCNYTFQNETPPVVTISGIDLNNKSIGVKESYSFDSDQNSLTFYFRTISIRSRKEISYYYRLKNGSKDWQVTHFEAPFARFSQLGSGEYVFQVKACNSDGVCSKIQEIQFVIETPLTQKWWFFLAVILVVVAIVFFILRARYQYKSKQNKLLGEQQALKKEVYKSKIAAIRSQMNPHFMFNALNTIQEFIVTNQQEIASDYLADFADLMRKYLSQSQKDEISLSEEIETLEIYLRLENLRFDGNLVYTIENETVNDGQMVHLPIMLIQPFVENSIKHGLLHKRGVKVLKILFKREGNALLCIVEDNGIGREASARINTKKQVRHQSFATSAIDKRIEMVNKSLGKNISIQTEDLYNDEEPSGTKVTIRIDNSFSA